MKICTKCLQEQPLSEFYKSNSSPDGYQYTCKSCKKAWKASHPESAKKHYANNKDYYKKRNAEWLSKNADRKKQLMDKYYAENKHKFIQAGAKRKSQTITAIPKWFEIDKVELVYEKAKYHGFEVDHIVPIVSPLVCGLHCWHNLQLLDSSINRSKGNRHWPDMP